MTKHREKKQKDTVISDFLCVVEFIILFASRKRMDG